MNRETLIEKLKTEPEESVDRITKEFGVPPLHVPADASESEAQWGKGR